MNGVDLCVGKATAVKLCPFLIRAQFRSSGPSHFFSSGLNRALKIKVRASELSQFFGPGRAGPSKMGVGPGFLRAGLYPDPSLSDAVGLFKLKVLSV